MSKKEVDQDTTKELTEEQLKALHDEFLVKNCITEELYNESIDVLGIANIEEYIGFHKKYQALSPRKFKTLTERKPKDIDMELFIKMNYPKSYQSNIEEIEEVSSLIVKGGEDTNNIEEMFEGNKPTLSKITQVNTLNKFTKIIESINLGNDIPIKDEFQKLAIISIAKNVQLEERIESMSIDSITALNRSKNWFMIWLMSNKTTDEIINKYKWSCSELTFNTIKTHFLSLTKKYPKV